MFLICYVSGIANFYRKAHRPQSIYGIKICLTIANLNDEGGSRLCGRDKWILVLETALNYGWGRGTAFITLPRAMGMKGLRPSMKAHNFDLFLPFSEITILILVVKPSFVLSRQTVPFSWKKV